MNRKKLELLSYVSSPLQFSVLWQQEITCSERALLSSFSIGPG
ncbi:hypothetical protein OROGR_001274 [Orobanche gracilis]